MDRWEKLWREHWAETHKPDADGRFYFDRPAPPQPTERQLLDAGDVDTPAALRQQEQG